MTRAQIIWITLLLISGKSWCQQRFLPDSLFLKSGNIFAEGGISFAVSDYGAAELTRAAGFATTGFCFKTGLSYEALPYMGFGLQYMYNNNPFDASTYLSKTAQAASAQTNGNLIYTAYTSDPWILHGVLFGVCFPVRSYNTTVTLGIYAGFLNATLPTSTLEYTVRSTGAKGKDYFYEATAADAGYSFQLGIRRRLWRDFLICGKAEFLYTEQEFNYLIVTDLINGYSYRLPDYTQYYHIINLHAGIAWQFR